MLLKTWVKAFTTVSITTIIIVSGINYIVNPYNIFGHGYDQLFSKKEYALSDRMSKFYTANRLHPKTIMMGTSRIGVFQESQLAPYLEGPIYNFSLAGSTIDEQAAYIEYMITHHKIKNVVWSLDFFSFNPTKPIDSTFEPKRLSDALYWNDYLIALFNFKTLVRSFKTAKTNLSTHIEPDNIHGQPFTQQQVQSNAKHTLHEYATEKTFLNSETFKNPLSIDPKVERVKKIIALCKQYHVNCILYTSPVYYQHIDMIYAIGLGKTFEYWKKSIATIHPYTDFCIYSSLSKDTMKFRDSSHVISNVGDVLFSSIFNPKSSTLQSDYAYAVTPLNVNQHIEQERKLCHDFSF